MLADSVQEAGYTAGLVTQRASRARHRVKHQAAACVRERIILLRPVPDPCHGSQNTHPNATDSSLLADLRLERRGQPPLPRGGGRTHANLAVADGQIQSCLLASVNSTVLLLPRTRSKLESSSAR